AHTTWSLSTRAEYLFPNYPFMSKANAFPPPPAVEVPSEMYDNLSSSPKWSRWFPELSSSTFMRGTSIPSLVIPTKLPSGLTKSTNVPPEGVGSWVYWSMMSWNSSHQKPPSLPSLPMRELVGVPSILALKSKVEFLSGSSSSRMVFVSTTFPPEPSPVGSLCPSNHAYWALLRDHFNEYTTRSSYVECSTVTPRISLCIVMTYLSFRVATTTVDW